MSTTAAVLMIFMVITFSIIPGIMCAEDGKNKIKSFFSIALVLPVCALISGLTIFALMSIPDSIINNGDREVLGVVVFFSVLFGGLSLGTFLMIKLIEKLTK
jgi:hypothetical protein